MIGVMNPDDKESHMEEKQALVGENENDPSTDEEPRPARAASPAYTPIKDRSNLLDFQWNVTRVRRNGPLPASLQPQNSKTTHTQPAEDGNPPLLGAK
jgi:hypothetical protein